MNQPRNEEIERRAYEIWERDGRPEGREEEHWRQAERELAGGQDGDEPPLPEHYAPGEVQSPGEGEADTALPEALAQAGEGVPEPAEGRDAGEPGSRTAKAPRSRRAL